MSTLIINPSSVSEFYTLIGEASESCHLHLSEEVESYLVFLLMRFVKSPEIAKSIMATEYLAGLNSHAKLRQLLLQEVGDKCLLMAGLFPARARKKMVKISYFVHLGQTAYTALSDLLVKKSNVALYHTLSREFVAMMDVLQTTRELDHIQSSHLELLEAYELWLDTKSQHALKTVEQYTGAKSLLLSLR